MPTNAINSSGVGRQRFALCIAQWRASRCGGTVLGCGSGHFRSDHVLTAALGLNGVLSGKRETSYAGSPREHDTVRA